MHLIYRLNIVASHYLQNDLYSMPFFLHGSLLYLQYLAHLHDTFFETVFV